MEAYSLDLRQRRLTAWQNQENTQRGLAKRFKNVFEKLSKERQNGE